jgi:hypothetical protein
MTSPSSSRDDVIIEQLRQLSISMAQNSATLQQHSEKFEAMTSTDARLARLEEMVTSLTTTSRSGGEPTLPTPATTARTPRLQHYIRPVRRELLPTVT